MTELLTYGILLDSLIVVYIQLVIMLRELKKVLSVQDYHSPVRMNHTKYSRLEINILCRHICVLYINIYLLYVHYIYTSEVCMSKSVILYKMRMSVP